MSRKGNVWLFSVSSVKEILGSISLRRLTSVCMSVSCGCMRRMSSM